MKDHVPPKIVTLKVRLGERQAAGAFLRWCECRGIMRIEDVRPVHVAGYIEQMQASRKAPTVKQHLACIRMLFDWLVTGQVLPSNPAHAVRGPRHSLIRGATTVMSSQETSEFLKSIDTAHVVGLRATEPLSASWSTPSRGFQPW